MIEAGSFLSKAVSPITWQQSTTGKSDQVSVRVQLLEGTDSGQVIVWRGFLSDKAIERTLEALENMGWDGERDDSVTSGSTFVSVVQHEEYEGKTRARIAFINDPAGGGGNYEPMPEPQKNAAKARLRALAAATKAANGGAASFDKF
jgi:hypothetical protein